jgi:hypothetical protein
MDEVFPVLAGIALGLVILRIESRTWRWLALGLAGIALGVTASWVSGELAISWSYVVIDTAQVLAAAVMTSVLASVWRRRLRSRTS